MCQVYYRGVCRWGILGNNILDASDKPASTVASNWDAIREFDWPGNVRQFLNVLKRGLTWRSQLRILVQEQAVGVTHEDGFLPSVRL